MTASVPPTVARVRVTAAAPSSPFYNEVAARTGVGAVDQVLAGSGLDLGLAARARAVQPHRVVPVGAFDEQISGDSKVDDLQLVVAGVELELGLAEAGQRVADRRQPVDRGAGQAGDLDGAGGVLADAHRVAQGVAGDEEVGPG